MATDYTKFNEYKEKINQEYIKDYIKNVMGKKLNENISCIYASTNPAHAKGTDNKPSMGYSRSNKTGNKYFCQVCRTSASIFDLVKAHNNLTTDKEALQYLYNIYPNMEHFKNDDSVDYTTPALITKADVKIINTEINTDFNFTDKINELNKLVLDSKKYVKDGKITDGKYLLPYAIYQKYKERGLTDETIKKYKLGASEDFNSVVSDYPNLQTKSPKQDRYKLILPLLDEQGNCYNFIAEIVNRKQIDNYNQKYRKISSDSGITTQLFNEYYLKDNTYRTIFITEGIYDSLSIEQMGYNSISLIGIGGNRLIDLLQQYKPNVNLILLMDNDTTGKKENENLENLILELKQDNIKVMQGLDIINNYENLSKYKDSNEMLLNEPKEFKEFLKENYIIINKNEDTERIDSANLINVLDYFKNIENESPAKIIPTGYKYLDEKLNGGIRTALYVLGAISSIGKTAFLLQMADQMAKAGYPVLYFSLEMDKKQLVARSISRTTFYLTGNDDISSTTYEILDNINYPKYDKSKISAIQTAVGTYSKTAKNMYVISGRYKDKDSARRMNINDIEKIIKDFVKYKEQTPIIFIDYMQIVAPVDLHYTDKQNMDEVVDRLKQISDELDTPVIAISSYNRDNYYEPANLSAFKESGAIEYGADYVMALQYEGLDEIYRDKTLTEQNKKRAMYELVEQLNQNSYKGEQIPIVFKILKSRNSVKFNLPFSVKYKYGYFRDKKSKY